MCPFSPGQASLLPQGVTLLVPLRRQKWNPGNGVCPHRSAAEWFCEALGQLPGGRGHWARGSCAVASLKSLLPVFHVLFIPLTLIVLPHWHIVKSPSHAISACVMSHVCPVRPGRDPAPISDRSGL